MIQLAGCPVSIFMLPATVTISQKTEKIRSKQSLANLTATKVPSVLQRDSKLYPVLILHQEIKSLSYAKITNYNKNYNPHG
jgi:hypothetical protein